MTTMNSMFIALGMIAVSAISASAQTPYMDRLFRDNRDRAIERLQPPSPYDMMDRDQDRLGRAMEEQRREQRHQELMDELRRRRGY